MKRRMHAPRFTAALLLLAAILAVIWQYHRLDKISVTQQPPGGQSIRQKNSGTLPTTPLPSHEEPTSRPEGAEDERATDASQTKATAAEEEVANQIESLLTIGLGRVTAPQARARIKEILDLPSSVPTLKRKLMEGSLPEKLLSIYALIEAGAFTNELFQIVLSDPSPYVQAEALHFLLRNRQFDRVDEFLEERLLKLDWNTVTTFLEQAASKPTPDLPVVLARLDLDKGLPLYLDLLADRSPTLRLAAFARLNDQQTSAEIKDLMLKLVDSTPGPELVDRLKIAFTAETNPTMRIRFAQYIAARSSVNDEQLVAFLKAGMPPSLPIVGHVDLRFSERRIETLREFEKSLMLGISTGSFDAMAINGTLTAYLKEGEMVGLDHLSKETLLSASNYLRGSSYAYVPDSIALAAYVGSRTK